MEIVGDGFLARHLRAAFGARHPGVIAIAAGVSSTGRTPLESLDREAELVYDVIRRGRDTGGKVVIFSTSSHALYGAADSPGTEDGPVFPVSAYGRHKLGLEAVVSREDVDWLVVRSTHLVGSGQPAHQLLPSLVAQVRSGTATVYRGHHRDLLDVRHLVLALDGLLTAGVNRRIVNVASGTPIPIERIVAEIETRLGVTATKRFVDGPGMRTQVSTELLRSLVPGWGDLDFGESYLRELVERYVAAETAGGAVPSLQQS
ncbi:NAD-dependent epimerase/dehydratase family protein [Actinoalloteichus hoggarensis]|uniref:NAD dependent epimerase/dehydratase family protein n=1 Tax=Actinoalloteichus hoggarensis TaxID=1470176 RepID=A0A221W4S6_9PSEU|nr:NAD-dependent epimerase/dehydratase family protein [Actinoalloteichus hoggarensis]ASO20656.1 NAD dependent epimerase/dehydratase family protein [Actinoalloteichus hoggarensis]